MTVAKLHQRVEVRRMPSGDIAITTTTGCLYISLEQAVAIANGLCSILDAQGGESATSGNGDTKLGSDSTSPPLIPASGGRA